MDLETLARSVWHHLPTGLRARLGPPLRRLAAGAVPVGVIPLEPAEHPPIVEVVTTLADLDRKLAEVHAAGEVSDDAMRAVFRTFRMEVPLDLPDDPYSDEYRRAQLELYRLISGRSSYEVDNELNDFQFTADRPFPYTTQSAETVGNQLMGIGFIIKTMGLPAGASVLDMGSGWGNTAIHLAWMGYDVHAVDIDPKFTALIAERAERIRVPIEVSNIGFLEVDTIGRQFDAVLFFESFHHCADHQELLRKLAAVVTPGGRLFFAAEPVVASFPMPWGLRLDGESLRAIRSLGWLELGFTDSYFIRTLGRFGWLTRRHVDPLTYLGQIYEAWRADGVYELGTFLLPPDEDATWAPCEAVATSLRCTSGASELTIECGAAYKTIEVELISRCPTGLPFAIQHGNGRVEGVAEPNQDQVVRLPYDPTASALRFQAKTWIPARVLRSKDERVLGIGVKRVTLVA